MKNYREIIFLGTLDEAVEELQEHHRRGERVCITFNGRKLYSDSVTMDSAYMEVTGATKEEFDKLTKQFVEDLRHEEEVHKSQIPSLTQEWITKGQSILDEKYWEKWTECVSIRLNDLYRGMELGACLDIIKPLNNGCEISEAADILRGQNHSGMSFSLVCSMVASFCDRGTEFVNFVNNAM